LLNACQSILKSKSSIPVYDPSTGAVMAQVAEADAPDVDQAVKAARKAYQRARGRMSPIDRGRILWKLADLIDRRYPLRRTAR
jgi:phenylacetaldehyde dehydrogenase